MIEFTIKTLESINHQFSVEDETTVAQLKEQIRNEMGIEIGMQRLIFCGRVLTDDRRLSEFGVNGKVIHLVPRPPPSPQSRSSSRNPRQEMREAIHEAQRVIDRMSHQPNNNRPAPRHIRMREAIHAIRDAQRDRIHQPSNRQTSMRHIRSLDSPPDLVLDQQQATMSPTSTRLEFIRRTLDDIRNTLTALFNEMGNSSGDATRPPAEPMETETSPPTVPNETSPTEKPLTEKPPTEMALPERSLPDSASNEKVPTEKPITETPQNESHLTETPSTRQEDEDMVDEADNFAYTSRRLPTRRGPLRPLRPSLFRPRDLAQLVDELDQLHEEFAPFRTNYLNILREATSTQLSESERVRRQNIIEMVCDVMHSFAHAYHAVSDINVSVGERFPRLSADFSSSRHQHTVPVQAHINVIPTVRQPTVNVNSQPVVRIGGGDPTPLAAFIAERLAAASAAISAASAARDQQQNPSHTTTGRDTTQATRNYPELITYQVEIETRVPIAVPIDATLLNNLVAVATNLQQGQILLSQQNRAGQQGLRQEQSQAQGQGQAQAQSRSQAQSQGQDQASAETARPPSLIDIESLLRTLSQAHPGIEVVMSMEEIHPMETAPGHSPNNNGPSEFTATIYGTLGDGPTQGPNGTDRSTETPATAGVGAGSDARPNVGSNAGPNTGSNLGANARFNASSNAGSNAAPNDSNTGPNARPSARTNAGPGAGSKKTSIENMCGEGWGSSSYTNPSTTSNTTPSTGTGTRPTTTSGTQPTTTPGTQPTTTPGTQPTTTPGTQSTTTPGTQPTMGPGLRITTEPGVRPATGHNIPPFGDIRGLRVAEPRPPTVGTMILDGPPGPHGFPTLSGFGTTFGPIGPGGALTFTPGVGVAAYGPASVTLRPEGGVFIAPMGSNNTGGLPGDVLQDMLSMTLRQVMNTAASNTGTNAAPSDTTATTTAPTDTTTTATPNNNSTTPASQFAWIPITSSFTSTTVAPNFTSTTGTQSFAWSTAVPLNGWTPMTSANASATGAPTNSTTTAPTNTTTTAPTNATTTAPTNTSTSASQSFRIPYNAVPSFTPASYATFNMNPYENAEGRSSDGVWGMSAGQEYPNVLHLESISMSPGPGQERVGPLTAMARARTVQQAEQRRRAEERINNLHDSPNERQRQNNNSRQHRLALNFMVYDRFLNCDSVHARHRLAERRASHQLQHNDQTRQRVSRPNAPDIDLLEQRNYRFTTRHMAIMMRLLSGPVCREGRLNAFMVTVARVLFLEPEGRRNYDPVSMPREFLFVRMQMREYIQRVVNTVVTNGPEYNLFDAIAAVIIRHNQGFLTSMRDYTSIDPLCAPLTTLRCWLRARLPIVIACVMSESASDAFVTRFYDVITRFYIDLCALVHQFCVTGFDGFRTLYTAFIDNATADFEVTSREWIRLLASENLQAIRNMLDPANPTNFFNRYDIYPRSRERLTMPVSTPPLPPARDDTPDTADSLPSTSIPTMSSSSEGSESPQPPDTEDASPPLDDGGSGADTVSTTSHNSIPRSPVQMRSAGTSPRRDPPVTTVQSEQNGAKDQNGETEQAGAAALPRPMSQTSTVPGSPETMEFVPPVMILEHWGEEWVPVFTRDRADLERTRTQEPFSDAYLSGMPSRKRRCLRASRPPTSLDGFMNESIREATDRAASLDPPHIRSVLRDSVRSLVRTRAASSVDYDPARYSSTARFLDQTKRNKKDSEPTSD